MCWGRGAVEEEREKAETERIACFIESVLNSTCLATCYGEWVM